MQDRKGKFDQTEIKFQTKKNGEHPARRSSKELKLNC